MEIDAKKVDPFSHDLLNSFRLGKQTLRGFGHGCVPRGDDLSLNTHIHKQQKHTFSNRQSKYTLRETHTSTFK